jgi:hypothetical protein
MKHFLTTVAAVVALTVLAAGAKASTIATLSDWCVNVNGDISTACNGAGGGSAAISLAGFDTTIGTNNLGSIVVKLGAGLAQSVLVYMDYDLNFATAGSFQDYGTVAGTAGTGVSYELEDPNVSNIFNDFAGDALTGSNTVGVFSGPPTQCCDVSWALGVNLNVTTSATVTFAVSTTAPAAGFYLEQTNGQDTTQHIFLSETVVQGGGGGGSTVPKPASLVLLGAGLAGLSLLRKRNAA